MEYPSSSSSSSSAHSSLTEYPQSTEYSSDDAFSTESSVNSSPKNPQHSDYHSFSPPPPPPPPLTDVRRSSPWRLEGPRREWARRPYLPYNEELAIFMRRSRCVRYYLAWNACMDEALGTGQDYQLMCAAASRLFRECVRHF